ncbi:MAG: cyclic nucleotide-binding domain-containing protein [Pseudomonadota bacterium]
MTKPLLKGKIQVVQVTRGVYWIEIKKLDLRILCACPPDVVKHLMLKSLILEVSENGIRFETGPNAILLSDIMLQNGQFSNMAEFPVLQMLYKQGMIIPDHPNNNGIKPLLIGSEVQINAQMNYIYRGNYGLVTYEEILDSVADEQLAKDLWRMKKKFAFGQIKPTEELLDSKVIINDKVTIKDKLTICRIATNIFEFSFEDESLTIDLNLQDDANYPVPYPLGFHDIKREYFSIIHSGQGDGFDVNRPCMSSIITFQGKIYIIDAGPNISYSLTTLGIGINEIEGVFQTHSHDDHFAGITTLLRSDHRIKFYATPMVRSSVFKKLAVLLDKDDDDFSNFFNIKNLVLNEWNDVDGLEVRPAISPHPVETTIFFFRTFWGGKYLSYGHFADITSLKVLNNMIVDDNIELGISKQTYDTVKNEYLTPLDLKKIDVGGGMIHGDAEDFCEDKTTRIILAHTACALTNRQKEIGSSAPFGIVDLMIPELTNILHRKAFQYLQNYFVSPCSSQIEKIINNPIILYPPGSLILKNGDNNNYVYLVLTGYIEKINSEYNSYNMLSSGSFIGEYSGLKNIASDVTFRSVSYVHALQIPAKSYQEFIKKNRLFRKIETLRENHSFLDQHWLFKEAIGAAILNHISSHMELEHYYHSNEPIPELDNKKTYLIKSGSLEISCVNSDPNTCSCPKILKEGDFFYFEALIKEQQPIFKARTLEPSSIYEISHQILKDIPIILWKLLETYNKQKLYSCKTKELPEQS